MANQAKYMIENAKMDAFLKKTASGIEPSTSIYEIDLNC